jgi:hypothetical protein
VLTNGEGWFDTETPGKKSMRSKKKKTKNDENWRIVLFS